MFLAFVCLHHWLLYSHRVSLCFTPFCADNILQTSTLYLT